MLRRGAYGRTSALIGNLMQNVSFYANTTIYVIAGLLALLGTMDRLIDGLRPAFAAMCRGRCGR